MGLDTTHGCWHGAYSAFHRWRAGLANAAGIPLDLMEGYYDDEDDALLERAYDWAKERDGGPICGHPYGPLLARYVAKVRMGVQHRRRRCRRWREQDGGAERDEERCVEAHEHPARDPLMHGTLRRRSDPTGSQEQGRL